jgi:NAD-dependent SIR2 family protein deacetylase
MYDTLQPDLITSTPQQRKLMNLDPTYVVTWEIFQQNQFPYMEVRRPFILGTQQQRWKATIAHRFMELLHTKTLDGNGKSKLTRIYTQNIDGLDHQCTAIPKEKIVNVHGSLSQAACEGCGKSMDIADFCDKVQTNIKDIYNLQNDDKSPLESTPILCNHCQQPLVKPTTVLFGRPLPSEFFERTQEDMPHMDLLIVAGTSLVVSPANSLVYQCEDRAIRVVVNQDPVGQDLGIEYSDGPAETTTNKPFQGQGQNGYGFYGKTKGDKRDFFAQGSCEEVFLELATELGWLEDLRSQMSELPTDSAEMVRERIASVKANE